MLGEVEFLWHGMPMTAVLDDCGRWRCDNSARMASLLNRLYFLPLGVDRREDAARSRVMAVAERFGGTARVRRRPRRFPRPRPPEDHPAFLWLGDGHRP